VLPKKNPTAPANGLSSDSANAAATSTPPPVASPIGVSLKRESPLDRGGFKHLCYREKKERFQQFLKTLRYLSMPKAILSRFCA